MNVNSYVPEKINEFNVYMDGTIMIGVMPTFNIPELNMQPTEVKGVGIGGVIDSPTIGQFDSMEQELDFNVLFSSAIDMLSPLSEVNITVRAAQQVYDKLGGYQFKGLRVVEKGRVKKFVPGKVEKTSSMEAKVVLEVTYMMIEVDGITMVEVDKLNQVYIVNGKDMLAEIRKLV